jgi:putative intracellular protease/amidase
MNAAGKSIVAIGHAPQSLVAAGLVAGRVVTGDASVADAVRNAGGQWGDPAVVEDRNGISSRDPRGSRRVPSAPAPALRGPDVPIPR